MRGRTASLLERCLPFTFVVLASAWISFGNSSLGEYPIDGGLAVAPLAQGDVSAYLSLHLLMGPFSTMLQAPFAAIGGGDELAAYQWACLPCLLAVGIVGLYLGRIAHRRGAPALAGWAIAALFLVNPLTLTAISTGHPEELLTGALAVAAVASAGEGHRGRATVLLGLALASKQWAVIAILPVLMALPGKRVRALLGAGAIALFLILPGFLSSPAAFFETQRHAAVTPRVVSPWNVWYPFAEVSSERVTIGSESYGIDVHRAPSAIASLSHPLIVLLFLAVPLGLALRRRRFGLAAGDAMALLALLALLRCALDPVDNFYYHAPLLLALIGWDAVDPRRLPLRSLAGVGVAFLFDHWSRNLADPALFNSAYIALALAVGVAIATMLFRPALSRRGTRRELDVRLTPAS